MLAAAFLLGVQAQAQQAPPPPLPEGWRGGWAELGLYVVDRYWIQLGLGGGAGAGTLMMALRGWRPSLPTWTIVLRHEVVIAAPVEVIQRHERVSRSRSSRELEQTPEPSEGEQTPEGRTPIALRPRNTLPPPRPPRGRP